VCPLYDQLWFVSCSLGLTLLVWVILQCQMCPTMVESRAEGGPHWKLGADQGMVEKLSSKEFSPTTLVMVYGPHRSGRSLRWGVVRRSFCKCSQTLSPTLLGVDNDYLEVFASAGCIENFRGECSPFGEIKGF